LFSEELEARLMNERLEPSKRNRPMGWAIALAILTAGIAGGAYASGDAIKRWIYGPFHVGTDGTVRDAYGKVVGESLPQYDGTTEISLQLDDDTAVSLSVSSPISDFTLETFTIKLGQVSSENDAANANADSSVDSPAEK
jgi:hypothetical protein